MLIERSTNYSILPEAVEILSSHQNVPLYHLQYGHRPPLGIYNVSLQKIWKEFISVLNELDKLLDAGLFRDNDNFEKSFDEQITDAQENLLLAIKAHFDDCENVIRCFFPAQIGNNVRNESSYKQYFQSINSFFAPVSRLANYFKHDQGRLRLFVMYNDDYAIPGYFAEAVDSKGRLRPHPDIHKPMRSSIGANYGRYTAFSFFQNLRFLFWGIYFVSYHLGIAIKQIVRSTNTNSVPLAPTNMDMLVLEIGEKISNLPIYFYEDEQANDTAVVTLITQSTEKKLRLEFPASNQLLLGLAGQYQNLHTWMGDGVTQSYALLYTWGEIE